MQSLKKREHAILKGFQNVGSLILGIRPTHILYGCCAGFTTCPPPHILKDEGYIKDPHHILRLRIIFYRYS